MFHKSLLLPKTKSAGYKLTVGKYGDGTYECYGYSSDKGSGVLSNTKFYGVEILELYLNREFVEDEGYEPPSFNPEAAMIVFSDVPENATETLIVTVNGTPYEFYSHGRDYAPSNRYGSYDSVPVREGDVVEVAFEWQPL